MAAAQQNYTIEQGQTFNPTLLFQIPGIASPSTGTTALGSTSLTSVGANLSVMVAGMSVTGPGIQPNTIVTVVSGSTLTLSLPAAAAGTGVAIVVGAFVAISLAGATLLFSAKINKTSPDTAGLPGVVTFNWQETITPTLGLTSGLVIANTTTAGMTVATVDINQGTYIPPLPLQNFYYYQIWGWLLPGFPELTPLQEGIITVTQSVSSRSS